MPLPLAASRANFRSELAHKLRGIQQLFLDLEDARPRAVRAFAWSLPLTVLLLFGWWYYATTNHRLLTGAILKQGNATFDSIRAADALSEQFSNPKLRSEAFVDAETELGLFQQLARDREEQRAAMVLSYYLDEVRKVPALDQDCVDKMSRAQSTQRHFERGEATHDDLVEAEVGELFCMSARGAAARVKVRCRDESHSYLISGVQPPTDECVFLHTVQLNSDQR